MTTKLKVIGGTRSARARRLCDTCEMGIVRRGASDCDEEVHCLVTKREVRTSIIECSRYVDRSQVSLWDMQQIAWVLHVDSRRQKIGFLRAKEWGQKHDDEELLPSYIK